MLNKKSIINQMVNVAESIDGEIGVFKEGLILGQILAYINVVGIKVPNTIVYPKDYFKWVIDTFKLKIEED